MTRRFARLAAAVLVAAALVVGPVPTAGAIPDTGAGADTPGTAASVSPSTLRAGETIHFRVSGFPAGEVINVKIDDGNFCAQAGVHGACVVHQQRIAGNGTVSGSLVLPADLKPGKHWLRFLASQEMYGDDGGYLGVKGFTLRGNANFSVVAGRDSSSDPSSPGAEEGSGDAAGQDATGGSVDVTAAGRPLKLELPEGAPVPSAPEPAPAPESPTPVAAADPRDEASEQRAADDASQPFPWLGAGVLTAAAIGSGLLVRRRLRPRG